MPTHRWVIIFHISIRARDLFNATVVTSERSSVPIYSTHIWTLDSWVGRVNTTSVLCRLPYSRSLNEVSYLNSYQDAWVQGSSQNYVAKPALAAYTLTYLYLIFWHWAERSIDRTCQGECRKRLTSSPTKMSFQKVSAGGGHEKNISNQQLHSKSDSDSDTSVKTFFPQLFGLISSREKKCRLRTILFACFIKTVLTLASGDRTRVPTSTWAQSTQGKAKLINRGWEPQLLLALSI